MNLKSLPIAKTHLSLCAKFGPFAGYEMPLHYGNHTLEHQRTRTHCGLFDVSHMGEVIVEGADATEFMNYALCSRIATLDMTAKYGALLNEQGGVVDDLIHYRFNQHKYLIVVNASNRFVVFDTFQKIKATKRFACSITDNSDEYQLYSVSGPRSLNLVSDYLEINLANTKPFTFIEINCKGKQLIIARTGYTGEEGCEIFTAASDDELFQELVNLGIQPCGIASRDSLRLEAGLPLHSCELTTELAPFEGNISFTLDRKKTDFWGEEGFLKRAKALDQQVLLGFYVAADEEVTSLRQITDPDDNENRSAKLPVKFGGIARHGHKLLLTDEEVGIVTSGTKSPNFNLPIFMALVSLKALTDYEYDIYRGSNQILPALANLDFAVDLGRGRKVKAVPVPLPFYSLQS